jgi:serine/threonine protein kinase
MRRQKVCEARKLNNLKFPAEVRKRYLEDTDAKKLAHVRSIAARLGLQESLFIAFQIGDASVFYGERLDLPDSDRRRICAVKVIPLADNYNENLKTSPIRQCTRELEFYQRTTHSPNVVDMYQFDFDVRTSTYLVTLEYSHHRDLFDLIALKQNGFGVEQARCIFSQIARGVNFLHREGIAHRDIKPANIIYCGGCFKLCDLGLACDLVNDSNVVLNTVCGTIFYISYSVAEEIERPVQPITDHLSQPDEWARSRRLLWNPRKNDVWALGVILHQLLVGRLPYGITQQKYSRYATKMRLAALAGFRTDARHEDGCADLLGHMLAFNEQERFTIRDVLRHVWVQASISATRSTASLPLSSADRMQLHRANYAKPRELA